jgi:hypothetical protein
MDVLNETPAADSICGKEEPASGVPASDSPDHDHNPVLSPLAAEETVKQQFADIFSALKELSTSASAVDAADAVPLSKSDLLSSSASADILDGGDALLELTEEDVEVMEQIKSQRGLVIGADASTGGEEDLSLAIREALELVNLVTGSRRNSQSEESGVDVSTEDFDSFCRKFDAWRRTSGSRESLESSSSGEVKENVLVACNYVTEAINYAQKYRSTSLELEGSLSKQKMASSSLAKLITSVKVEKESKDRELATLMDEIAGLQDQNMKLMQMHQRMVSEKQHMAPTTPAPAEVVEDSLAEKEKEKLENMIRKLVKRNEKLEGDRTKLRASLAEMRQLAALSRAAIQKLQTKCPEDEQQ